MSKGRYCCFKCPKEDYSLRDLEEKCPSCGRPYGFPLTDGPNRIDRYFNLRPLDRGFYAVTYEAETGTLSRPVVLKVVPMAVYEFFGKDFMEECRKHRQVAEGTEHLVKIMDAFEYDVDFGEDRIRCHIAELEYISGTPLSKFLAIPENCNARSIAQVAIDLFTLMAELEKKEEYHNDLHSRNIRIQQLPPGSYRARAIDGSLRAVAIDLGSVSDISKSDPQGERLGDLREVVVHLLSFRDRLLANPWDTSDLDYRLASLLDEIVHSLAPDAVAQRTPDFTGIIQQIEDGYNFASSPWEHPGPFKRFNDSYNAQTLHPWFVPRLLVDPDGQWFASVSAPGPQVITGIRGCGKTMVLRSLQFHARASAGDMLPMPPEEAVERFEKDGFVGLYVSCTRLLDALSDPSRVLHQPYTRLYLAYAREALRAARHLRQIATDCVSPLYWRNIANAVKDYVAGFEELNDLGSDIALERQLLHCLVSLDRGEVQYSLSANPAVVFPHLAEAVRQLSSVWANASVLFLLDDVSTRHLQQENISELLGTLLFSSPICAFKMTTEVQTLEQLLRSPGLIETARPGRDYDTFDLGAAVNQRLRDRKGPQFIAEILQQRAKQYPNHPLVSPRQLLGDATLESIARHIAITRKTSSQRKKTYHGLRALSALCVGDIGDVLSIYEEMLRRHGSRGQPIPARTQSECFQEYCSRRLYHLNRQGGYLKDFALEFAEASHELLIKSARDAEKGGRKRLRQYSTIYVRLTTGDTDKQFERIRDLTDKGVFVLEGGTDAPRSKTRDSNPMQQFILTYRKLFGLSSYVGLAESDRFELSGKDLEDWLVKHREGKAILMRNLGGPLAPDRSTPDEPEEEAATSEKDALKEASPEQLLLVPQKEQAEASSKPASVSSSPFLERAPKIQTVGLSDLATVTIDTAVFGLGFEDRTLASVKRVLELVTPSKAVLVRYPEVGHAETIERLVGEHVKEVRRVDYLDLIYSPFDLPDGTTLVDVTGLAKPIIFKSVLQALTQTGRAVVSHTEAQEHFPLNADIEPILQTKSNGNEYEMLEAAGRIWSGEQTPYTFDKLIVSDADESRRRLLCAAASAKHERLLSLLDERSFDYVDIIVPSGETPRSQLARLAADVAIKGITGSKVKDIHSDDLEGMLRFLATRFADSYVKAGFNIELALTGSKMHAVACAAACAAFKVAQCWYVRPREYDPERFTKGVGDTQHFILEIKYNRAR